VVYAYAVDGLDWEQREAFDARLNAPEAADRDESPTKKRDQARAQAELMAAMGGGARRG
jgi:hypothetical protein